MYLINGAESETLAVNDRSVQFGDGCFTTARIVRGQVQLLSAHLARLQKACEQLFIPYDDWALLAQEMAHLAQSHQDGVLKVIITRGAGARIQRCRLRESRENPQRIALAGALSSLARGGDLRDVEPCQAGTQSLARRPQTP